MFIALISMYALVGITTTLAFMIQDPEQPEARPSVLLGLVFGLLWPLTMALFGIYLLTTDPSNYE